MSFLVFPFYIFQILVLIKYSCLLFSIRMILSNYSRKNTEEKNKGTCLLLLSCYLFYFQNTSKTVKKLFYTQDLGQTHHTVCRNLAVL